MSLIFCSKNHHHPAASKFIAAFGAQPFDFVYWFAVGDPYSNCLTTWLYHIRLVEAIAYPLKWGCRCWFLSTLGFLTYVKGGLVV